MMDVDTGFKTILRSQSICEDELHYMNRE